MLVKQAESGTSSVAHVEMHKLAQDEVLAARRKGEAHRAQLERAAGLAEFVILDFAGVAAVSSSYFLGGPWALWTRRLVSPEQYCVIANLPADGAEDVELVARYQQQPIWSGRWSRGRFRDARILGELDATDGFVLKVIAEEGRTTAAELHERDESIGVTGWNNRLAALHNKKILRRWREGRKHVYAFPWTERS